MTPFNANGMIRDSFGFNISPTIIVCVFSFEKGFAKQEDAMTDFRGGVISSETIAGGRQIINSLSTSEDHAVDFTDDDNFTRRLTLSAMWLMSDRLREYM